VRLLDAAGYLILVFVWYWAVWAGVLITIDLGEGLLFEGKREKMEKGGGGKK